MNIQVLHAHNKKIQYVEEGIGEPLFLIHGWGMIPQDYEETVSVLSKQFHVVSPFLIGAKDTDDRIDRIFALIENLKFERVIVVAHSFGAIAAIKFTHYFPERVKALVLADSMGIMLKRSLIKWVYYWLRHVSYLILQLNKHKNRTLFQRLTKDVWWQFVNYPLALPSELKLALANDSTAELEKIKVPILILWGADDTLIPMTVADRILQKNGYARLELQPGGHEWINAHPQILLYRITTFLESL